MIIAIDFDGTLTSGVFPAIGMERICASDAVREIHSRGHYIILWTCRTDRHLLAAINFLLEKKIPFDRINDHAPDNIAEYGPGGNKIFADVYIDDMNLGGFPGWPVALEILRQHPKW